MAISRAQLLKELLPGLNALFGLEYARPTVKSTKRSTKPRLPSVRLKKRRSCRILRRPGEGRRSAIAYDNAQEAWTARYNHETIAFGFSITEEAVEDNLYDSLSSSLHQGAGSRYGVHQAGQGGLGP
jgi:hypothetical protein